MTVPGSAVSMDEIAAELDAAKQAGVDPATLKLDGDKIPEALRGKTVADILKERDVLEQSVKIANEARKAAESRSAAPERTVERVVERPAPVEDKRMTKEELASLYESDPIAAVAYMNDIATKDAEARFERRFGHLAAGSASAAEQAARTKYAETFELFGDEIKTLTDAVQDKSALGNPMAWESIISYVRGKPGNFEKLLDKRAVKAAEAAAEEARKKQEAAAGGSVVGAIRPTDVKGGGSADQTYGLDELEMKTARDMDMSYKDYAYWKKIGG